MIRLSEYNPRIKMKFCLHNQHKLDAQNCCYMGVSLDRINTVAWLGSTLFFVVVNDFKLMKHNADQSFGSEYLLEILEL